MLYEKTSEICQEMNELTLQEQENSIFNVDVCYSSLLVAGRGSIAGGEYLFKRKSDVAFNGTGTASSASSQRRCFYDCSTSKIVKIRTRFGDLSMMTSREPFSFFLLAGTFLLLCVWCVGRQGQAWEAMLQLGQKEEVAG